MEITKEDIVRMTNGMHAASVLLLERNEQLKQACLDVLEYADDTVWVNDTETLVDRLVSIGVMSHEEAYGC